MHDAASGQSRALLNADRGEKRTSFQKCYMRRQHNGDLFIDQQSRDVVIQAWIICARLLCDMQELRLLGGGSVQSNQQANRQSAER